MKDDKIPAFFWLKDGWNALVDNFHRVLPVVLAFQILAVLPPLLIWTLLLIASLCRLRCG